LPEKVHSIHFTKPGSFAPDDHRSGRLINQIIDLFLPRIAIQRVDYGQSGVIEAGESPRSDFPVINHKQRLTTVLFSVTSG
jgi:hypothetical protein